MTQKNIAIFSALVGFFGLVIAGLDSWFGSQYPNDTKVETIGDSSPIIIGDDNNVKIDK